MVRKAHNLHTHTHEGQIFDDCGRTGQDIQPSVRTTIALSMITMT